MDPSWKHMLQVCKRLGSGEVRWVSLAGALMVSDREPLGSIVMPSMFCLLFLSRLLVKFGLVD